MTPSTKKALIIIPIALVLGVGGGAAAKYDGSEPAVVMAQFQADMSSGIGAKPGQRTEADGVAGLRGRMDQSFIDARDKARTSAKGSTTGAALKPDDTVRSVAMHALEGDRPEMGRIMSTITIERTGLNEFHAHHTVLGSNTLVFTRSAPTFLGGTWKLTQVVPPPAKQTPK